MRCWITGEVLEDSGEASHIIPRRYANLFTSGTEFHNLVIATNEPPFTVDNISNGCYIRADLHMLFDKWALGVCEDDGDVFKVWAFTSEAQDFHGRELTFRPGQTHQHPSPLFCEWHFRQCLFYRMNGEEEESDDELDYT